jgi:molybdopterin converting factor small subunit
LNITVEFTGLARSITGERQITLPLPDEATYQRVVQALGEKYPSLIGVIIAADGAALLNANVFSKNGDEIIPPDSMDAAPEDGDRLILISVIVGGRA